MRFSFAESMCDPQQLFTLAVEAERAGFHSFTVPKSDLAAATVFFAGRPLVDPTAKLGIGWVQQGAEVRREQVALRVLAASGADRRGRAGEVGERGRGGHWTCESRRARRPSVGSG